MVKRSTQPVAILTALVLAVFSVACVLSCLTVPVAMPPCHHHHAQSCAPLFLSHAAAVLPAAAPEPEPEQESLFTPAPAHVLLVFLSPPVTLRI
jgi:hypothetical protein